MSGYLPGLIYGLGLNQSSLPTGGGLQLGQTIIYNVPDGGFGELMLVQAGATITANKACKFENSSFSVIPTDATTDICDGVNDVASGTWGTGASISNDSYFLMTIRGICKPLIATGVSALAKLQCTATSGTLDTLGAGTYTNMKALAGNSSGVAAATLTFKY